MYLACGVGEPVCLRVNGTVYGVSHVGLVVLYPDGLFGLLLGHGCCHGIELACLELVCVVLQILASILLAVYLGRNVDGAELVFIYVGPDGHIGSSDIAAYFTYLYSECSFALGACRSTAAARIATRNLYLIICSISLYGECSALGYSNALGEGELQLEYRGLGREGNIVQSGGILLGVYVQIAFGHGVSLENAAHGGVFKSTLLLAQVIDERALAGSGIDVRSATLGGTDEDMEQTGSFGNLGYLGRELASSTGLIVEHAGLVEPSAISLAEIYHHIVALLERALQALAIGSETYT